MTPPGTERRHKPFVPEGMQMSEFTMRALFIGLVMTIVLGAANAYLGLRAGQTIAATYPAAVIGMAVLRAFKGSILEDYDHNGIDVLQRHMRAFLAADGAARRPVPVAGRQRAPR